ncbi:hypothetical protein PIB30_076284, partial [Stylosanthes scabra]|nr:hypothetical protein [Stylosanthes scabra]
SHPDLVKESSVSMEATNSTSMVEESLAAHERTQSSRPDLNLMNVEILNSRQ